MKKKYVGQNSKEYKGLSFFIVSEHAHSDDEDKHTQGAKSSPINKNSFSSNSVKQ
jgi:hypothetical protein